MYSDFQASRPRNKKNDILVPYDEISAQNARLGSKNQTSQNNVFCSLMEYASYTDYFVAEKN